MVSSRSSLAGARHGARRFVLPVVEPFAAGRRWLADGPEEVVSPAVAAAVLGIEFEHRLGVVDGGFDLGFAAYDTGIGKQQPDVVWAVPGDNLGAKPSRMPLTLPRSRAS